MVPGKQPCGVGGPASLPPRSGHRVRVPSILEFGDGKQPINENSRPVRGRYSFGSVAELVTHDNEDKRLAASRLEFGKRPLDTSGYVLSVAAMQVRLLPEPLCFVGDFIYTHT